MQQLQDPLQLRSRVIQLAGELFERISLEGLRMEQALRKVEALEEGKYRKALAAQRQELEAEALRLLAKREEELQTAAAQAKQVRITTTVPVGQVNKSVAGSPRSE